MRRANATSHVESIHSGGTRIAPGAARDYPWYVRLIFALQRRKYGAELEPARLWGRLPRAFFFQTLLYRAIDRADSPIEPGLRALVQVRISQINWCAFCVDANSAAALAFAEAATDSTRRVDDACFARLASTSTSRRSWSSRR